MQKSNQEKFNDLNIPQELMSNNIAKIIGTNIRIEDLDARKAETLMEDNMARNSSFKLKKKCAHLKVSFPKEERPLDDEELHRIGKEILKKLNYGDAPAIYVRHEDEPFNHFHIIASTRDQSGNYIDGSNEGIRCKYIERDLEEKYGLIKKQDRIQEHNGVRNKGWKEMQMVDKHGVESFQDVTRRSLLAVGSGGIESLEGFTRALARESVSVKFFSRKYKQDGKKRYGISYAFDQDKVLFKFNENANMIKPSYGDYRTPSDINKQFQHNKQIEFNASTREGESVLLTASRDQFNGPYISPEGLLFPPIHSTDQPIGLKGQQAGSRFSYYNLQDEVGFTNAEVDKYIEEGNKNEIYESPEISKFLYSVHRFNAAGVQEALSENAEVEDLEEIDIAYLTEEKVDFVNNQIKIYNEKLHYEKDELLKDYEDNYFNPNEKTIELLEAYRNEDWLTFSLLIPGYTEFDTNQNQIADPRIIPRDLVENDEDISSALRYKFANYSEFIEDMAIDSEEIAHKADRPIIRATMPAILALENKQFDELVDAIENPDMDVNRLNFDKIDNWMNQEQINKLAINLAKIDEEKALEVKTKYIREKAIDVIEKKSSLRENQRPQQPKIIKGRGM